jgi:hypothetical protein
LAAVAGVYEASPPAGSGPSEKYAVNLDPRESDVTPTPLEQIPPGLVLLEDLDRSTAIRGSGGTAQRPLERSFLLLSLVLLVAEGCYAWSLGRRR